MHNLKYCGLPWKLIKLPSRILKYVMTNVAVLKGQMSLIFFTGLGHPRSFLPSLLFPHVPSSRGTVSCVSERVSVAVTGTICRRLRGPPQPITTISNTIHWNLFGSIDHIMETGKKYVKRLSVKLTASTECSKVLLGTVTSTSRMKCSERMAILAPSIITVL